MRAFAKTFLAVVGALVAQSNNASAFEDSYCSCSSCEQDASLTDSFGLNARSAGGLKFTGWIDGGFIGNASSPTSKFNGPYNAVDRSNEGMMNQLYLIAEKELPSCSHGIGGRIDYLYGTDFFLAESIGIEKRNDGSAHWNKEYYGSAFPQAYLSLGSQELNLQLGHFYSIVGYEGVMAPDNFFYSKSYSYQFAGPFTHWGGQLNYVPSEALSFQIGLHNGWDAFDRTSDKMGWIGKVKYDSQGSGWTSFAITTGDEFNDPGGVAARPAVTQRSRFSWLIGLPISCKLDYVFHYWRGRQDLGAPDRSHADWYGIDQYLTYDLNSTTDLGVRFEWFRDVDGTRVGLNRDRNLNNPPFAGDIYSLSLGANWAPRDYLIFRPELRADWYDGVSNPRPFDDGEQSNQFMLGFDVILKM